MRLARLCRARQRISGSQGITASLTILDVPSDKPEKWDAADAVAEG